MSISDWSSDVCSSDLLGHHAGTGLPLSDYDAHGGQADLVIYQSSTGSSAVDWLLRRSEPLAVNYHNITPASFFEAWDDQAAASMRRARAQLRSEEHTSALQSLMRISYAVFCLKKK